MYNYSNVYFVCTLKTLIIIFCFFVFAVIRKRTVSQLLPLKVHSFRKCRGANFHPSNLLKDGTNSQYASAIVSDFTVNEEDWIIFEIESKMNEYFIPEEIRLQNGCSSNAIASMQVLIGSIEDNQWLKLHSTNMIRNIAKKWKSLVTYKLDGMMLEGSIKRNGWKHICIHFLSNHGCTNSSSCKFVCYQMQFYGSVC